MLTPSIVAAIIRCERVVMHSASVIAAIKKIENELSVYLEFRIRWVTVVEVSIIIPWMQY